MMRRAVQCAGKPLAARAACPTTLQQLHLRCRLHRCHSQQAARVHPHIAFPHSEQHQLDSTTTVNSSTIMELLTPYYSEERLQKLQQVVTARCYGVIPVVEGLYDMGNLAAVCRSADALGFGAVHCILSRQDKYKKSQRAAAGADKWLDSKLWDSTPACLTSLKAAGYKVLVTHLGSHSVKLQEWDWTQPTAFVLGNEKAGVSQEALELADATMVVPMTGFVESFNISVAAALIMYEAQQQLQRAMQRPGDLGLEQQQQLLAEFMLRGMRNSKLVAQRLLERPPPQHQKRYFRQPKAAAAAAAAAAGEQVGSGTSLVGPDRLQQLKEKYANRSALKASQQQQQAQPAVDGSSDAAAAAA